MRMLHPSSLDIDRELDEALAPECDCDNCEAAKVSDRPSPLESSWMLLGIGFIVALTAIGISLIIIWSTIGTEVPLP